MQGLEEKAEEQAAKYLDLKLKAVLFVRFQESSIIT